MNGENRSLRALIVDDEPFARERVRRLLAREDGIEVMGECKDGYEAVAAVKESKPDLMFLDVQMPGRDGFEVLAELAPDETPVVIFLTAYDSYAVRAFDHAALDYLLKPFDEERFARAVARARAQLERRAGQRIVSDGGGSADAAQTGEADVAAATTSAPYLERIIIRAGGRVVFRRTDEIDWVEAYGNYVRLHISGRTYLLRETLANLEARLDPEEFARVHRSAVVRIDRIREMRSQSGGGYLLVLASGEQLTMSRRYRRRLPKSLADTR